MTTPSDQIAIIVVALDEALDSAEQAVAAGYSSSAVLAAIHSAQASVQALSMVLDAVLPLDVPDTEPELGASDDPATCGHPETFPFPADSLCRSCGATRGADGVWGVL
jgi:hypothetical protein